MAEELQRNLLVFLDRYAVRYRYLNQGQGGIHSEVTWIGCGSHRDFGLGMSADKAGVRLADKAAEPVRTFIQQKLGIVTDGG